MTRNQREHRQRKPLINNESGSQKINTRTRRHMAAYDVIWQGAMRMARERQGFR